MSNKKSLTISIWLISAFCTMLQFRVITFLNSISCQVLVHVVSGVFLLVSIAWNSRQCTENIVALISALRFCFLFYFTLDFNSSFIRILLADLWAGKGCSHSCTVARSVLQSVWHYFSLKHFLNIVNAKNVAHIYNAKMNIPVVLEFKKTLTFLHDS